MHRWLRFLGLGLLIIFLSNQFGAKAQVFAPERSWATTTEYVATDQQDSIFVFFPTAQPELRAQFSDLSPATYKWYWYNQELPINTNLPYLGRFQEISDATDSLITVNQRGGYLVQVTHGDSTESYIAWAFVDDVKITRIAWYINCDFLELEAITSPNRHTINYEYFTYFDISRELNHIENNELGRNYFDEIIWEADNDEVVLPEFPFILMTIEDPPPYFDSAYSIEITNIFGRNDEDLEAETEEIKAVATKAVFDLYFYVEDDWQLQEDEFPREEALLEMKLISQAKNADSIFWNILNDELRFQAGGDSIIWSDSAQYAESLEFYPPERKMVPGFYDIEHISKKWTDGNLCHDRLVTTVEVDTSFIKSENIPNVFTPGGIYPVFVISPEDVQSIRSFRIAIFNRWGKQVYAYSGDPKEWEGWNGKINNSKNEASPGVYYYIIDAEGWDGVRYRKNNYRGAIHLYR